MPTRQLLVLLEVFSSDPRIGAVNDALDLAHYGEALGMRFIICGRIDDQLASLARKEGMRVVQARSRMIGKRDVLLYAASVLGWIVRLLTLRPDVVHLNYAGYGPSLACAARMLRIPIVVRAAATYDARNLLNKWADLHVANGRAHGEALLASPLEPRVRITGDLFRPERLQRGQPERPIPARAGAVRFLFLGQLTERKGLAVLVDAFARLRADADLLLVGGDWQSPGFPQQILNRLHQSGLAARVHRENHRGDIAALLEDCDVFVLPSLSEARPRVIIEAMCMGRPVVASRVGGVPEIVEDGITGLLVPPDDPAALADALRRLAESADLRLELGRQGRIRAERDFHPERTVERYLAAYREAAAHRGLPVAA